MDREYEKEGLDTSLDQFDGYEDYLNSHLTSIDTSYLEDEELARQLVAVGVQGKGEILSKEEFDRRKRENDIAKKAKQENVPKKLASADY